MSILVSYVTAGDESQTTNTEIRTQLLSAVMLSTSLLFPSEGLCVQNVSLQSTVLCEMFNITTDIGIVAMSLYRTHLFLSDGPEDSPLNTLGLLW